VQVIVGVVLHPGLTAWLHVAGRVSRMPSAAHPQGVRRGGPAPATRRSPPQRRRSSRCETPAGSTVYRAPVASLANVPSRSLCEHGAAVSAFGIGPAPAGGYTVSRSSSGAILAVPKGSTTIP
jgi:hypothetical protein